MKIRFKMKMICIYLFITVSLALTNTLSHAQGVPVIDQTNILKSIDQLNAMLKNIGIQTDILDQAKKHLGKLQEQLSQLKDIYNQFSGLRNIAGLELPNELNGILTGNLEGVLSSFLNGANGDWSGLNPNKVNALTASINRSLQSFGMNQQQLQTWSSSGVPIQSRIAQQASSGAVLSATAEQTYQEAGQSLQRVQVILQASANSQDIKESIDNNTRMLAELAIQLAKSLELNSIQAAYDGQSGVSIAADRAEENKFFTFGSQQQN